MATKVKVTNSEEFYTIQSESRGWANHLTQDLKREMNGTDIESAYGAASCLYHNLVAMRKYWFDERGS